MQDIISNFQYDKCVSLGWFCGTAYALARHGLRSHSGPFDWYFSDYWAVLKQIESNFSDFLTKDNLRVIDGKNREFEDTKYGFYYNHDVQKDFEAEYPKIYSTYMRRVNKFLDDITMPTVFFRTIRDQKEVEYINENWKYAEQLLKSKNPNNLIIYLLRQGLSGLTPNVSSFRLMIPEYTGKTYEMRHMFESNKTLIELASTLISPDKIEQNIHYDVTTHPQKIAASYVNNCVHANLDGIDDIILDALGASKDDGIYLWGAGKMGISLAKYLIERNIRILGLIDNNAPNEPISSFNIMPFNVVPDGSKIFIAIAAHNANDDIMNQINKVDKKIKAVRYADLYYEGLDVYRYFFS